MKVHACTLILAASVSLAHGASRPKPHPAVPSAQPLQVTTWFSLREDSKDSPVAAFADLAAPAPIPKGVEQITVFGSRHDKRDAAWRAESAARVPTYEASNSDAAQPLVPYAAWSSPQQERFMAAAKEELGLCHWPLTCPDP